jgi:hypothetical protein
VKMVPQLQHALLLLHNCAVMLCRTRDSNPMTSASHSRAPVQDTWGGYPSTHDWQHSSLQHLVKQRGHVSGTRNAAAKHLPTQALLPACYAVTLAVWQSV